MWITLRDPDGPSAGTIAPEDLTFDETRERYARFTADIRGTDVDRAAMASRRRMV